MEMSSVQVQETGRRRDEPVPVEEETEKAKGLEVRKMIKVFCEVCGKELSEDFSDAVNLDFNSFGVSGFVLEIGEYKPKPPELNLCVECAGKVVSKIEELRKISRMKENKENEAD